jgi:hypothetical protein
MNYPTKLGLLIASYVIAGSMIGASLGWLIVRINAVYG